MKLSTADKHQLKIAKQSLKLTCGGCSIMGGSNHKEAANIIKRLTGKQVKLDKDCTCLDHWNI